MMKRKTNSAAMGAAFLAICLLLVPPLFAEPGRGMRPPVEDLPESLRGLPIQDAFVPAPRKEVGRLHALDGHVVVVHTRSGKAYFAMEGDTLYEDDTLHTLSDSRCRIRLLNEDVVRLAAETEFTVNRYMDNSTEGQKSSLFSMVKGKAMFYALRLFRYKKIRFTLKTPTAVAGVRGTKFGAHVYWAESERRSRAGVLVADLGHETTGTLLAQADPVGEVRSFTDLFAEDGVVEVNGQIVGPGEMYKGDTGRTIPTPPEVLRLFRQETEVRPAQTVEIRKGVREGRREKLGLLQLGMRLNRSRAARNEILSDTQTLLKENTIIQDFSYFKGKIAGRASAITTMITGMGGVGGAFGKAWVHTSPAKGPVYKGGTLLGSQKIADTHSAYEFLHKKDDQFKLELHELSPSTLDGTVDYFTWGHAINRALGTPHVFEWNEGGHYRDDFGREYLTWGYWEDTTLGAQFGRIGAPGNYFAAAGRIWGVGGALTHPDIIRFLHNQNSRFTYTGQANGVYAETTANDVHELKGVFRCRVDFGSSRVRDFELGASGGGHSLLMNNGSGTLSKNGAFELDGFQGSMDGTSIAPALTGADGALFGGKAEGVGGGWRAGTGTGKWAAGEFHGKR